VNEAGRNDTASSKRNSKAASSRAKGKPRTKSRAAKGRGIEIISFVGPAGTGKSQRALSVARQNNVDYIIDDGLVIRRGQIMAGKSAKAEKNMIRALRRALFTDPEHRAVVLNFLLSKAPCRVMLLGTSHEMIDKILATLELPPPVKSIEITDVSTPDEIESALSVRKEHKLHTIPVSRTQIQRSFAGKLVDQIKDMLRWGKSDEMRTIVTPPYSFEGQVVIEERALVAMLRRLLRYQDEVEKIKVIDIGSDQGDGLVIDVVINVRPRRLSVLNLGRILQRKVRLGLGYFTGMEIKKVNIHIDEINTEARTSDGAQGGAGPARNG
jgi:uncharacterized alkaline shock family protein YloU